ncbi:hypothetical protein ES706_01729 [subsurface metagenome]
MMGHPEGTKSKKVAQPADLERRVEWKQCNKRR